MSNNKVPYDKQLHITAGLGTSLIIGIITNPLYGLEVGILIGIVNGLYDYSGYGIFEIKDMLYTFGGAVVGSGIVYLLHTF